MKLFILAAFIGACSAGVLNQAYLPPHSQSSAGAYQGAQGPGSRGPAHTQGSAYSQGASYSQGSAHSQGGGQGGFSHGGGQGGYSQGGGQGGYSQGGEQSSRPQAAYERNAAIVKQDSDVTAEGFHYSYETENGIRAEESAHAVNGVQSQGGFSYTGDDGQQYSISYTADENGFQAQGAHLPTSPPIPEEILKALEQNARDEANGIVDDGSYNDAKYSGPEGQFGGASQQYGAPAQGQGQHNQQYNQKSGYRY